MSSKSSRCVASMSARSANTRLLKSAVAATLRKSSQVAAANSMACIGPYRPAIRKAPWGQGFALVAYPTRFGDSGVMTFIVNQNGIVLERNLGPHTGRLAPQIMAFDPDSSWRAP